MKSFQDTSPDHLGNALTDGQFSSMKELNRSEGSIVYRVVERRSGSSMIMKVLNVDYPDNRQIARFQYEYTILRSLSSSGIIEAYGLKRYRNTLAILLEDINGTDLSAVMESIKYQEGISVQLFLTIAVKLCSALGDIHKKNIIHKQIHPGNIIFNPVTGQLKIIDFGSASQLLREEQEVSLCSITLSDVPYISPEQTGRTSRKLDYRTDFYSLGMTLYELLTGQLPFSADGIGQWVYCHIAKLPRNPLERNAFLPKAIADIVLKLIKKNPEERYQSVHGIVYDLNYCLRQWEESKKIHGFILGQKDFSEKFQIPSSLVGRDNEMAELLEVFQRVTEGATEFMLVSGYSGVGKSTLIHELYTPIVSRHGEFIKGKFDRFNRDIPYSAFSQAFSELAHRLLGQSNQQLDIIKKKLADILGPNGRIIIDLIPEMEWVMGTQPEIQELNPKETRNRLIYTVRCFISVFATRKQPLVIFFDDLQWADMPSLELIRDIVRAPELHHLFVLGAFRNNEVDDSHPLRHFIDAFKQENKIRELALKPLDEFQVNQIVARTLQLQTETVVDLNVVVYTRTQGNPFFIGELLKAYHEWSYIYLDHDQGRWSWDSQRIEMSEVPENIVDFLVDKLSLLPESTQTVLRFASCIGTKFDLKTLSIITGLSPSQAAGQLWEAIENGIIAPLRHDYHLAQVQLGFDDFDITYKFLHDRIHQAAYQTIGAADRRQIHLDIGRLMLQHTPGDKFNEKVIEIVHQINEGRELITDSDELLELAELNLKAGKKAKASSAYRTAFDYLRLATDLLGEDSWHTEYQLTYDIYMEFAELSYLCGAIAGADQYIALLLAHAKTDMEKARVYYMQSVHFATTEKLAEALVAARQSLAVLGFTVPENPGRFYIMRELLLTRWFLGRRTPDDLYKAPMITDERMRLIIKCCGRILPPSYWKGDIRLFIFVCLKVTIFSLRSGLCSESSISYLAYGTIQTMLGNLTKGRAFGQLALQLNERFQDMEYRAIINFLYANLVHHWNDHWLTLLPYFRCAIETGHQSGDLFPLGYSLQRIVTCDTRLDLPTSVAEGEKSLVRLKDMKFMDVWNATKIVQQFHFALMGKTNSRCSLSSPSFSGPDCLDRLLVSHYATGIALYFLHRTILFYLYEEYPAALTWFGKMVPWKQGVKVTIYEWIYRLYHVLILTALYPGMTMKEKFLAKRIFRKNHKKFRKWAAHCPVNFLHHQYLMEAEFARIKNRPEKAALFYDKAIEGARLSGYLTYEALFNELAAKFHLGRNSRKDAGRYMKQARYLYDRWGATAKVYHLMDVYGAIIDGSPEGSSVNSPDRVPVDLHHSGMS